MNTKNSQEELTSLFYKVDDIASLLGTTKYAIYTSIYEGKDGITIPPSVKLGKRRLWLKEDAEKWFSDLKVK